MYPFVRRTALGSYPWRFTMRVQQLSRDAQDPIIGWDARYIMPLDRLSGTAYRLFESDQTAAPPIRGFEDFSTFIHTNHTQLWMEYTVDSIPNILPDYLTNFIVHALAAKAANPLTRDAALRDAMHQLAFGVDGVSVGLWQQAKTLDAQARPPRIVQDNSLLAARFGPVGSYGVF